MKHRKGKNRMPLEPISENLARRYIEKFNAENAAADNAIKKLIEEFPDNVDLNEITWKVSTINDLYNTYVYATLEMAKHLHSLNIDQLILNGDTEAVHLIANLIIGDKKRYCYSFATKYCNWHNQGAYPMYDKNVKKVLFAYRDNDNGKFGRFSEKNLKDYPKFKRIIQNFMQVYNLEGISFKEIDKFLWKYGEELNSKE